MLVKWLNETVFRNLVIVCALVSHRVGQGRERSLEVLQLLLSLENQLEGLAGLGTQRADTEDPTFWSPPPFTSSLWGKTSSLAHFDVKIKQTGAARMSE